MKRRLLSLLVTCASVIALTSCSTGELVAPDPAQSAETGPNLDSERIAEVLASVQETIDAADSARDSALLEPRVGGGAKRVRAAQYAYATASGDSVPALDLSPQHIAITNSQQWPRAILNIRQATPSELPLIEVLVQDDARSDYALTAWCRMLGGTSVTIPSIDEGSAYVSNDSTGFVMTPGEALSAYTDMLNASEVSNASFATDEFTTQYVDTVQNLSSSLEKAGTISALATPSEEPVSGVVLQDGSALVAAHFTYTLTYSRTIARSTMRLGGQTATMNAGDDDTVKGSAVVSYVATILLNIPSAKQGGVARVVGAERIIESVTMDDSSNPDGN